MGLMRRDRTAGEFVLRFARLKKIGDKKFLGRLFKNEDKRFLADALITERLTEIGLDAETEEEGFLARLFAWLSDKDNRALLEELIAWITALFGGE